MIRQTWRPLALLAVMALAAATTAAATAHAASAFGSLTGRVVTHTGEPAGNIAVTAQRAGGPWLRGSTASDGTYAFSAVPAGDYTIMVEPVASVRQYVPQQRFSRLAQVFAVREGEATVVNETLLPQGNLAGRFVDFDGTPLAGTRVSVSDLDGEAFPSTQTDANGSWRIDGVFAGRYQVHFSQGDVISQRAYGKVGVAAADVVTVAPNTTTTVNDTALARTSVRVTATDSQTGARLNSFRVSVGQQYVSTDTGELVIDGIQAGTHEAEVFAEGYFSSRTRVTVTAGQQGQLAAALEPQSFITVRVVDAATGAPVPNFCVAAMTLTDAVVPDSLCSELTDESGNLRIGWLHAGTYQLFATRPRFGTAPDYGSQWVGADGGTGRQLLAQSVRVGMGQTVAGPVIRLDRPGTITGQVSTPDGQIPLNGRVGVLVGHPFAGTELGVPIAADGRYTINFLGPYAWPLLFEARDQAPQWSGNVGNRHFARVVKVNAGATTTFDFGFRPAVSVTVKVRGLPSGIDSIVAVNAITGDFMGGAGGLPGDSVTMRLVGPQLVKLLITPTDGERRWVGGDDFLDAQPFGIPATGFRTITVDY